MRGECGESDRFLDERNVKAFRDYVRLKLHFNDWKFDCRQDRIRANLYTLLKRDDSPYFYSLFKEYPDRRERHAFLTSCFLYDKHTWVGDMFREELKEIHRVRMRRFNSTLYTLKNDAENLSDYMRAKGLTLKEMLLTKGLKPLIIAKRRVIEGGITLETLAVLDKLFNFTRFGTEDLHWEETRLQIHKYGMLIKIDNAERIKKIINKLLAIGA